MTVALVGVLCFTVLLAVNWTIGRTLIYPGVALAGIWALEFVVQALSVGVLYPVSWAALAIFVLGAICFTGGAVVGNGGIRRRLPAAKAPVDYPSDRIMLWALALLLIAGMPVFLVAVRTFTSAALFSPTFFLQVRAGSLAQAATMTRAPLVNNLVVLSSIAALIAYAVMDAARRSRLLVWGLVALAIFYNLLTGAKAGAVTLVVALFAVNMVLRRRVPVRFLLLAFVGILVLFGIVTVGRVESLENALSWQQSIITTWRYFVGYFSASPVGFSIYLQHPASVPAVWSPWRFFERTANYFGHYFDVPDLNARFVAVGPGMLYNTYTAYFSYYGAYGVGGVIAFMTGIGAISAWVYRKAVSGRNVVWVVLYGIIFHGLLMTIFSESLLLALNFIGKLILVAVVVELVRRFHFRRRSIAHARLGARRPLVDGSR